MRIVTALGVAVGLIAVSGCTSPPTPDADGPRVVATLAPLADLARAIVPDAALVLPAGAEPHDAALGPAEIAALRRAPVVFTVGGGFQPAIEDAVDPSRTVDLAAVATGPEDDPHVWLDPLTMAAGAGALLAALERRGLAGAVDATAAGAVADRMRALDRSYRASLRGCARATVITTHAAFGHLAARYGLDAHGIVGLDPGAGPDPKRLEELIDLARATGTRTIFAEPGEEQGAAATLAREAGAEVAVLDPIEVLPDGVSYEQRMRENLDALADGLGCRR